jgi:GDP-L-fucose synthase
MSNKPLILLTGSGGMVGRNILEHPMAQQFSFICPTSAELNLRNFFSVKEFFSKASPDFVIHAAGRVGGIQANMAHPVDFLVENVDIGRNVILASRNAGVKKLLNLSSSCVYPRDAVNPLSEDLILKGELESTNEGYALAKIFAMRLCQYIQKEDSSFQYKTLIPCNLFGRFDKFDPKHSHLIPAIIHKIHLAKASKADTVDIWGDGTARREFMYAGELASAVFKGISTFEALPNLMNVGLGIDYSINEYYEAAAKVIGWNGEFVHDLSKPVGMMQKLVSIKLQNSWGWKSASSLEEGIQKTYDFYLKSIQ